MLKFLLLRAACAQLGPSTFAILGGNINGAGRSGGVYRFDQEIYQFVPTRKVDDNAWYWKESSDLTNDLIADNGQGKGEISNHTVTNRRLLLLSIGNAATAD